MTAVIYARYSSDNQREESIEGQIRECTAYAEKNGITVVKHYIDRALSAKTDNRPDFQQMIKAELKGGYLTILASYAGSDHEGREGSYIKRERYSGHYKRSFYVGNKVSEQDIKARFANGVLYVYVPKFDDQPEVEEKKIISIEG